MSQVVQQQIVSSPSLNTTTNWYLPNLLKKY